MHAPDTPHNETQRLAALHTLQVLDTPQDTAFERLTQLARDLFDVPIALVSLVDKERQWFKSHLGLDVCETNRAFSFCAHAIAHDAPLMIADTHKDERFADNPLVIDSPRIRFYAGYPLRPLDDMAIGTLCIIDQKPRQFSERDLKLLGSLAGQAEELLRLHKLQLELTHTAHQMHKEQKLLKVLHQGITDYPALMSGKQLWLFLMEALRELTDSDYALIGEVLPTNTTNALKIHAITDLSWSEESRHLMGRLRSGDMTLTNPKSLLGNVFAYGEVIMTNDVYNHVKRGGFPPGHPPLHNYLGVPIFSGERLIGMYAIANSKQPLNQALLDWLQPFTDTCALLINLYSQMAEREQVMGDLAAARDQAETASRAKSEFLSSMSHELRTPLNAIIGFAQILTNSRREPLGDKQHRQVSQIERSGQHLLSLINEVLDLAKIEAGHMTLSIEPIILANVFNDACSTLEASAEAAGIRFRYTSPNDQWQVNADYTRTKQILLNLLSNAIKYNSTNGSIDITVAHLVDHVRISVTDTGPGIAPERQHELFEPFNRLDAEGGSIEGSGIGLAITRELVERMNGEMGVDSQPGHGATFWFTLPTANADATADEAPPPHWAHTQPSNAFMLLYIEDNPANQRLMEDIIEEIGDIKLQIAPSAEIGLEIMRHCSPALVLMDIHLPGMNGYQALEAMHRDPKLQTLPVVALSANAMPGDIKRGLEAGFNAYLTKPLELDKLKATIAQFIQTASGKEP
ncbi:GAF domain-containing protein [Halomonas sp. FeN2]|uniref:GAF domain-containing hybrid sensor histidine kinase/response regulator n=1 Tax=Halomonas sp. FeN2 TaxID=2832500 RepID=UPI000C51FE90|nr:MULTISPECIES: ATP-binding protein [unclassified Halomonas]MBF59864.1 histidine kinase [Halomonas sp.]UBR50960.1 GAF domain-containing protein [Halomonas sp. FeN2]|tara:strand:+ start:825 stop:3062 length:2238 start_codon:yes stop_codon:yes gene_type:complete